MRVKLSWFCVVAVLVAANGCAEKFVRPTQSTEQLLAQRQAYDERGRQVVAELVRKNLERIKARHDAFVAGSGPAPVVDLLVISGGGDWGAFGAGFLKGWGTVNGDLARPREFDVVTGVSTGALIAPFAFLGDDESIEKVVRLYRNPKHDWVKPRGLLTFLNGGESYAEIPGLERELDETISLELLQRIADAGSTGRMLAVNTTEVDMEDMHVWDLTAEARRDVESGKPTRVREVLLASSAIPGAFPPRSIDGGLYVDGGVSGNIIYGGRTSRQDGFIANWIAKYPGTPIPKIRYWVIFNNEFRWPPTTVQPRWGSVVAKASTTATRSATVNAMRLLFAQAEIARLMFQANIEVRIVAVPDGWTPPVAGVFKKEAMNALADMGERMGADPTSWRTEVP